jgi:hypothetical protein
MEKIYAKNTGRVGMFKEFKEFAMRGNVVDMAVGIVIGAAFGTISSPSWMMCSCRPSACSG